MNMIAMVDHQFCIGVNGDQPIHLMKDLKRFKELTENRIVIYGRKTLATFPKGEPLKGRTNIIISRSMNPLTFAHSYKDREVIIINNISNIRDYYQINSSSDVYVIGGESMYNEFISDVEKVYLTEVDTYFEDLVQKKDQIKFFPFEMPITFNKFHRVEESVIEAQDVDRITGIPYNTKFSVFIKNKK